MPENEITIDVVRFEDEQDDIRRIRNTVFTDEQGIDSALDFDGRDGGCVQVLARDAEGRGVGTARMMEDGHIGRIAVLAAYRGRGIGSRLTQALVRAAQDRGLAQVYLNSQVHAVAFYQALDFETSGRPFMEAGIEHVCMVRTLETS